MKSQIFNILRSKSEQLLDSIYQYKNEDIPAFLIQDLFHQGMYLPYTSHSLKMRNLACICNDVVINSKNNILELGSGISTIILARLLKKNNLNAKITSIDESLEWINILKNILQNEDLLNYVDFLYAPTVKSLKVDLTYEYPEELISNVLKNQKFDLILIDGPKAWPQEKKMSRASNSKIIKNHLEDKFSIFIDNANRVGEKLLINEVQDHLNINPTYIDKTFAVFSNQDSFHFII